MANTRRGGRYTYTLSKNRGYFNPRFGQSMQGNLPKREARQVRNQVDLEENRVAQKIYLRSGNSEKAMQRSPKIINPVMGDQNRYNVRVQKEQRFGGSNVKLHKATGADMLIRKKRQATQQVINRRYTGQHVIQDDNTVGIKQKTPVVRNMRPKRFV